jgi:nicotinamidase-related amidase
MDPATTALLVIDMQRGFEDIEASGIARNNKGAQGQVVELLRAFRREGARIIHVRHASRHANSVFCSDRPGFLPIAACAEQAGESVIVKQVNSAFIGTDLEERLRRSGIQTVVIAGASTNHCVETTARMAGNLGFDTRLARDATFAFDRTGPDGETHRADDIHQMTLANLAGEFAAIATTAEIVAALAPVRAHLET